MTAPAHHAPARSGAPRVAGHHRPDLTVVDRPRLAPPRAPFVALVVALLAGGLVSLLLLNTALAQGAFTLRDLQRANIALTDQQQSLSQQLADDQQPAALAQRARALGMVPAGTPAFLHLPGGTVAGQPHVAPTPAPPPPPVLTKPAPRTPGPQAKPGSSKNPRTHQPAATQPAGKHPSDKKPSGTKPTSGAKRP